MLWRRQDQVRDVVIPESQLEPCAQHTAPACLHKAKCVCRQFAALDWLEKEYCMLRRFRALLMLTVS